MSTALPPDLDGLDYVQPLGSGGYADVFLYEQQMPRMKVAVKVLKADGLTPAIKRQFIDEANTMAQLADHPYIVQVFRSGTSEDGRPFLVMKYYPPPNLAQRARSARFSVEEVLRTGIHLASAVETAHRAGVIHRDIKPANVLVSQYGTPGLTDFGIAGRGGALEDLDDDIGVSVPWAPPEVLFGQSNGDARADVYSLAATLWQLLVGRSPFEVPGGDNSTYALMPRIRSNPPPGTGRADVPQGLERLLAQAMAKNPLARPATALEFARSLQQIEQEERFSRTAIVVLDEQGHSGDSSAPPANTQDRTRLRASSGDRPVRTSPPPPLGQPVIGGPLSGGRTIGPAAATRIASGVGNLPDPFAQKAATSGPPPSQRSGPAYRSGPLPATSGPHPGHPSGPRPDGGATAAPKKKGVEVGLVPLVASIVGALLVLGIIGGVVWWSGRDGDGGSTSTTTDTGPEGGSLQGAPTVKITVEGTYFYYKVSYDGLQDGDKVQIMTAQDADSFQPATAKTVDESLVHKEHVPKGAKRCVKAQVVRGTQRSAWSEPQCDDAR